MFFFTAFFSLLWRNSLMKLTPDAEIGLEEASPYQPGITLVS